MTETSGDKPARKRDRREYNQQWYLKNRGRILEQQRQYQAENPDRRRRWYLRNHGRILEQQRQYQTENRDRIKEYQRQYYLKNSEKLKADGRRRRHGLDDSGWAAMWDAQEGRCYLCSDELDNNDAHIDHDHSCCGPDRSCPACRRGLAHKNCNVAIGAASDDPDKLRRMADALERAKSDVAQRMQEQEEQVTLF